MSDLLRYLIINQEGGFYVDLDEDIENWTVEANRRFDFIGFTIINYGYPIIWSTPLAAAPGHPVLKQYLEWAQYTYNFDLPRKSIATMGCFPMSKGQLLFETGPYVLAGNYQLAS